MSAKWTWPCCFLCYGLVESSLCFLSLDRWVNWTHPESQEWHVAQWHGLGPQTAPSLSQKQVCGGSPRRTKTERNTESVKYNYLFEVQYKVDSTTCLSYRVYYYGLFRGGGNIKKSPKSLVPNFMVKHSIIQCVKYLQTYQFTAWQTVYVTKATLLARLKPSSCGDTWEIMWPFNIMLLHFMVTLVSQVSTHSISKRRQKDVLM